MKRTMAAATPALDIPPITEFTPGARANLRYDVPAGVVVFLVALPLCLGIALASNAPLFSGVVTGAVAGLLVAWFSGSELSVSGPAAGLTVIVAAGIAQLGSFEAFLGAVFLAGLLQILFGLGRAGVLAGLFPTSVIKGMLAGIGLIIVLKQIPHALGHDADFEGDLGFLEFAGKDKRQENTFSQLMVAVKTWSGGAVIVTLVSFAILFLWARPKIQKNRLFGLIPAQLLAVVAAVVVNELLHLLGPGLALRAENEHLVQLPIPATLDDFFKQFKFPDFYAFGSAPVYNTALTIAIVASIETLLCVEATDKLDPMRRISSKSRELMAQGAGNAVCGLLGGLPMTSVIVRSSANIYAGARTRMSSFVHGVLMALTVLAIPALLNRIPLACLAAILIVVGYKLASVDVFKKMFKEGIDQWLPFVVTIIAIVFTDLLKGVLIGFGVGLVMVIRSNFYTAITTINDGKDHLIKFTKDVSFVNNIRLKRELAKIPDGSSVWIDGTRALFIDHDIQELIVEFRRSAHLRGISVHVTNVDGKQYPLTQRAERI
jgi:MFS superfamily sulfate permease-like transporter